MWFYRQKPLWNWIVRSSYFQFVWTHSSASCDIYITNLVVSSGKALICSIDWLFIYVVKNPKKLEFLITELCQGRKGMLYDVCFDLFREKQPKFFKFFKNFLFNFLNFQTKINFEKKFPSKRKIPLKYFFSFKRK